MHPLAAQFASVADAYERGRPDYSADVIDALQIAPGARVLDLGAGTGKLSRALVAGGFDVVAVEPLDALRELLAERIGAERVREGMAEQIPLADGSVDAVTVADAFHWFDRPAALEEIHRVLRPGGGLALVTTMPEWNVASWSEELWTLILGLRPEHPHIDGPPWEDAVCASAGWTEPREVRVTTSQPISPERILDYLTSVSWVAAMSDEARASTLERARAIVEAGDTPPEMPVHFMIGLTAAR